MMDNCEDFEDYELLEDESEIVLYYPEHIKKKRVNLANQNSHKEIGVPKLNLNLTNNISTDNFNENIEKEGSQKTLSNNDSCNKSNFNIQKEYEWNDFNLVIYHDEPDSIKYDNNIYDSHRQTQVNNPISEEDIIKRNKRNVINPDDSSLYKKELKIFQETVQGFADVNLHSEFDSDSDNSENSDSSFNTVIDSKTDIESTSCTVLNDVSDVDHFDIFDNNDIIRQRLSNELIPLPEISGIVQNSSNSPLLTCDEIQPLASSSIAENLEDSQIDDVNKDPNFEISNLNNNNKCEENAKLKNNEDKESSRKSLNSSSILHVTTKYNNSNTEAPDYSKIRIQVVKEGPRKRKKHLCKYCLVDQVHLKRHLLRKHRNETSVLEMLTLSKGAKGSRKPAKKLIHKGDMIHNTNKKFNDGTLRVVRALNANSKNTVDDYAPCPVCGGMIVERDYRAHVRTCSGINSKDCRGLVSLGRKMLPKCSANASNTLRHRILNRMRNDAVLRTILHDSVIIEYGNGLCSHLRGIQHKENICVQLRRLGRIKLALKATNLADVLVVPANSRDVVKAIIELADPINKGSVEYFKYPTVAENLCTLIKAVIQSYRLKCIRENSLKILEPLKLFAESFAGEAKIAISRTAAESRGNQRRLRNNEIPSISDINILYNYLKNDRIKNYNVLVNGFNETAYINILKATLTSLQTYNRKRPGDVQRIYLQDYYNMKTIEVNSNEQNLTSNLRDLAKEFSILLTRGKLGNDIKLLVPNDIKLCLDMIIRYRDYLNISSKNHYLFALPKTVLSTIRYPSAYHLLIKFSQMCGAENPKLLRATKLRKQLATACINLNLNDADLLDLARYMGHHVNIHKSHYRKDIVERDIIQFTRFLNAALDSDVGNRPGINDSDHENTFEAVSTEVHESPTKDAKDATHFDDPELSGVTESAIQLEKTPKRSSTQSNKTGLKSGKKIRWSEEEKKIVNKLFCDYINKKAEAPSNKEIKKMLADHPKLFENRNCASIKTYLYNLKK